MMKHIQKCHEIELIIQIDFFYETFPDPDLAVS